MFVSQLSIYPMKSCRAVDLQTAHVTPKGLENDRRWMLVDAQHHVLISQRDQGSERLALVVAQAISDGGKESLHVRAPGQPDLEVRAPDASGPKLEAALHKWRVRGTLAPRALSDWFSTYLGRDVLALYQTAEDRRLCTPSYAVHAETDEVTFADAYPVLVTNTATLEAVEGIAGEPIGMRRFRPNLTIESSERDFEYRARRIAVGDVELELVKPCDRCITTRVDQAAGKVSGPKPDEVLRRGYFINQGGLGSREPKQHLRGVIFGMNAIPLSAGTIRVGDKVQVTQWSDTRYEFQDLQRSTT